MQNTSSVGYPHNIIGDVDAVVALVTKEAFGYKRLFMWLATILGPLSLGLMVAWPPVMVTVGPLGMGHWVLRQRAQAYRLQDNHLALLATIGFHEREAGKLLQSLLQLKGFVTLEDLKIARAQYDADNIREYNLRCEGAKSFLAAVA